MQTKFVISTPNGCDFYAWLVVGDDKDNANWTKVAEYHKG